ncbi:MAG: hypothetical protein ACI8QZ_003444 [Chlamydiales bacterium]|jgi:hypothetical protein
MVFTEDYPMFERRMDRPQSGPVGITERVDPEKSNELRFGRARYAISSMSQTPEQKREVIEVVAEPMEEEAPASSSGDTARRLRRSLSPVIAGLIIDVVDLGSFSPLLGFPAGLIAGYVLAKHVGFAPRHRMLASLVCGLYCTLPPTRFFPLATMIGMVANFRRSE